MPCLHLRYSFTLEVVAEYLVKKIGSTTNLLNDCGSILLGRRNRMEDLEYRERVLKFKNHKDFEKYVSVGLKKEGAKDLLIEMGIAEGNPA